MDDTKKWWESSGIWGALGTIITPLAAALGYTIEPSLVNDTVVWIAGLITTASGGIALWGRWRAAVKIG